MADAVSADDPPDARGLALATLQQAAAAQRDELAALQAQLASIELILDSLRNSADNHTRLLLRLSRGLGVY